MKRKLFKVPLKARLKDALKIIGENKIELGQLKSYIDELEYDNAQLRKRIKILTLNNEDIIKDISKYKKSLIHKESLKQIKALEAKSKRYKTEYEKLFHKYAMLQQEKGKITHI